MVQKILGLSGGITENVTVLARLNNLAISLLGSGCYKGAMETFHDALAFVKCSSADPSASSRYIKKAEKRTAAFSPSEDNRDDTESISNKRFITLSHRYDVGKVFEFITTHRDRNVCISIDLYDRALTKGFVRYVLLYNFGIAHIFRPSSGKSDDRRRLYCLCIEIFKFAESAFSSSAVSSSLSSHKLCRLLMYRKLMMLTCRFGLSECERYRKIVDSIEFEVIVARRFNSDSKNHSHCAPMA